VQRKLSKASAAVVEAQDKLRAFDAEWHHEVRRNRRQCSCSAGVHWCCRCYAWANTSIAWLHRTAAPSKPVHFASIWRMLLLG
jgi:hypothetical protein